MCTGDSYFSKSESLIRSNNSIFKLNELMPTIFGRETQEPFDYVVLNYFRSIFKLCIMLIYQLA